MASLNDKKHKPIKKLQHWFLIFCYLFVFASNIYTDGLHPVSVLNPPIHHLVPSGTTVTTQETAMTDTHDSFGTHYQWSGVLLLSLLQQQQQNDDFSTLNNRQQLLSSSVTSTSFTTANNDNDKNKNKFSGLERDKVERILDANTIMLQKKGVVRLAGVRMPSVSSGGTNSNFQFPTCFTYSPSYKIRQLLPKKTVVQIQTIGGVGSSNSNNVPQVVLIRNEDSLVINQELVKTGFAVVKNGFAKQQQQSSSSPQSIIIDTESLLALQEQARSQGLGIFSKCDETNNEEITDNFVAIFEPLERSMETVYLSDGGKRLLRDDTKTITFSKANPPKNPGDVRGCSDFESYEEALAWFEIYQPYYGDIAKLDRDGDGVPCPGLPHTTTQERYRMKVPTSSVGIK